MASAHPQNTRVPKLAYRNPASSSSNSGTEPLPSASFPDLRLLTTNSTSASPGSPISDSNPNNFTSPEAPAAKTKSTSKDAKKKKTNSILGFLKVKEPSQAAYEQLAKQQRKQTADKGKSPVGLPGLTNVTPAKLPENVPRVNSKWDGIPETVKATEQKRKNSTSEGISILPSIRGTSLFSRSSGRGRNASGSTKSGKSPITETNTDIFMGAGSKRKGSGPPISPHNQANSPMSSPSTSELPEMSFFFPGSTNPQDDLYLPGPSKGPSIVKASLAQLTPLTPTEKVTNEPASTMLPELTHLIPEDSGPTDSLISPSSEHLCRRSSPEQSSAMSVPGDPGLLTKSEEQASATLAETTSLLHDERDSSDILAEASNVPLPPSPPPVEHSSAMLVPARSASISKSPKHQPSMLKTAEDPALISTGLDGASDDRIDEISASAPPAFIPTTTDEPTTVPKTTQEPTSTPETVEEPTAVVRSPSDSPHSVSDSATPDSQNIPETPPFEGRLTTPVKGELVSTFERGLASLFESGLGSPFERGVASPFGVGLAVGGEEIQKMQETEVFDDDDDSGDDNDEFIFELQKTTTDQAPKPSPPIITSGIPRPNSMNFSRPHLVPYDNQLADFRRFSTAGPLSRPGYSGLPTLYEVRSNSSTESDESHKHTTTKSSPTKSPTTKISSDASTAPTLDITATRTKTDNTDVGSDTPSDMPASGLQSSRERLGLGGRIRKSVVLPWESYGDAEAGKQKKKKKKSRSLFGMSIG